MSVIKTGRNFVCAYEALPEDQFVQTFINGEPKRYLLLTQPIVEYQQAVDFAVSMSEAMAGPIEVVPITGVEYLRLHREELEFTLASMSDEERREFRHGCIAALVQVMRDCDDPAVRTEAYDLLIQMEAVRA